MAQSFLPHGFIYLFVFLNICCGYNFTFEWPIKSPVSEGSIVSDILNDLVFMARRKERSLIFTCIGLFFHVHFFLFSFHCYIFPGYIPVYYHAERKNLSPPLLYMTHNCISLYANWTQKENILVHTNVSIYRVYTEWENLVTVVLGFHFRLMLPYNLIQVWVSDY